MYPQGLYHTIIVQEKHRFVGSFDSRMQVKKCIKKGWTIDVRNQFHAGKTGPCAWQCGVCIQRNDGNTGV